MLHVGVSFFPETWVVQFVPCTYHVARSASLYLFWRCEDVHLIPPLPWVLFATQEVGNRMAFPLLQMVLLSTNNIYFAKGREGKNRFAFIPLSVFHIFQRLMQSYFRARACATQQLSSISWERIFEKDVTCISQHYTYVYFHASFYLVCPTRFFNAYIWLFSTI